MKKLPLIFFSLILSLLHFNCDQQKNKPISSKTISPNSMTIHQAALEYKIKAQLGEGAFWNYKSQEFYWIDIEGEKLHIYDPETNVNRSFSTPSRIGTVVPSSKGQAIIALEDGMYLINTITGDIQPFSDVEAEMTENRFNDGKCDPAGRLWVGSMHLTQAANIASLYKIEADGTATQMLDSITISNGIVWSKDQKTMYYIDTPKGNIRGFDYDLLSGTISNERVVVTVPGEFGFPDGMAIDENDHLWVGMWNGNGVICFDPKTGKPISKIEVPAHNVTACAFGGENLETLYITTASIDMTDEEKIAMPNAGSIFVASPGVKGVKNPHFRIEN